MIGRFMCVGAGLLLAGATAASPAAAQDGPRPLDVTWSSNGATPSGIGGMRTCAINAGSSEPKVNFAVNEYDTDRSSKLRMIAPWLKGQPNRAPVAVEVVFPDGSSFEGTGVYGDMNDITVTPMPSLDSVLDGLSKAGVLVVTIDGKTHAFVAPDLGQEIAAMRACVAALPAAKPE